MGQGAARWIAIALVGALVATLAVGLLGGGGEAPDQAREDAAGGVGDSAASEPRDGPHVVAFLCSGQECPRPDPDTEQAILEELQSDPRVLAVRLVTSDEAYELFLQEWGDREDMVEAIDPEQVPARIELDLVDPETADEVVAAHTGREGIAAVEDARLVAR